VFLGLQHRQYAPNPFDKIANFLSLHFLRRIRSMSKYLEERGDRCLRAEQHATHMQTGLCSVVTINDDHVTSAEKFVTGLLSARAEVARCVGVMIIV
jgi:hypothetical protein